MSEYISREAVINITTETGAWETQNRVRELPAADVQPVKRGRWVWDSNAPYRDYGAYKCSNCGSHIDFEENYCYNCGAKMEQKDSDTHE